MCRSIKRLANLEPPATEEEVRESALQFVRKLAGTRQPSRLNRPAFDRAVDEVAAAAKTLLSALATKAPPRSRDEEDRKRRERARQRRS